MKMKQLKTRHALLVSCISLLTSFAMLLSCTYAWFTDTATSGANRIEAGKFRVEAYHQTWQGTKPTPEVVESDKIEGKTDLFKSALNNDNSGTGNNGTEYKLWEPGAMAVETFTIKNEGELALKYQFNLVAAALNQVTWSENSGTSYDLRDVIKVAIVSGDDQSNYTSRTDFESLLPTAWKSWTDFVSGATKTGNLLPNKSESFIVAMWWQSTPNDNYYNLYARDLGKPSFTYYNCHTKDRLIIDVKTVVTATQDTVEADSFGIDYDNSAYYPAYPTMLYGTGTSTFSVTKSGNTTTISKTVNGQTSTVSDVSNATVEITVKTTSTETAATQTIGSASVPAAAAESILNNRTSGLSLGAGNTYVSDDLELTLNVETTSATETSLTLDVTMDSLFTRKEGSSAENAQVTNTVSEPVTDLGTDNPVTVTLNLEPNLQNVSVTHTHGSDAPVAMTQVAGIGELIDGTFYYNANTGELTLMTSKFSEFLIAFTRLMPTAVVTSLAPPNSAVDLLVNQQYANSAHLDKAYTFAAFNGEDQQAVEAFIESLKTVMGVSEFNVWNVNINNIENHLGDAMNGMDDSALKARMQQLIKDREAYLGWRADYTVSFDRDIDPGSVALGGQYDAYSEDGWVGFGISDFERNDQGGLVTSNPTKLTAGTEMRLLDTMFAYMNNNTDYHMNYATICLLVNRFNCGFANLSEKNVGATMTVRLCLFELNNDGKETGRRVVCGTFVEELQNVAKANIELLKEPHKITTTNT